MSVVLGVAVVGQAEGAGAVGEGVGGVAVHEAADSDQVGGVAAGGEDYGLQLGMGAGEVGDFFSASARRL